MFAGIVNLDGDHRPENYINTSRLLETLSPYQQSDKIGIWRNQRALIGHSLKWNTASSKYETTPYQCPSSKLIIASWLRLDNRQEVSKLLALDHVKNITDPMLVLAAYRKWGKECADKLEGDFSFVIYDPIKQQCFAARDSIGIKPLYYFFDEKVFIFSSTAALFPRLTNFQLQPNEHWIALRLVRQSMSFTETGFKNVLKLPPAHSLEITQSRSEVKRYFKFQDNAPSTIKRNPEWVSSYRHKLDEAVRARLNSTYLIGSETSGGLDSSTITALAALNLPHDKKHFHVFGYALYEQEPDYLLATSQYHTIPHNHIYTQLNPEETREELFEREMTVLGYPCEHGNATSHLMFYRLCEQHGIRTLLSGFGGDEVVTNSGHLLARELIGAGHFMTLFRETPGHPFMQLLRAGKRIYQTKFRSDVSYMESAYRRRLPDMIISNAADQKHSATNEILGAAKYDASYHSINQFILEQKLRPFVSTRTESCSLMAASFGVDYRWPLLDRRLMQQYLSTPSIEKNSRHADRYLHRRAVTDILPRKVAWKNKKSVGERVRPYEGDGSPGSAYALPEKVGIFKLHPILEPLVDQEKFNEQVSYLKKVLPEQSFDKKTFIPRRNYSTVCQLNDWLKYFF